MRRYVRIIVFLFVSVIMVSLFTNSSCDKGVDPDKKETLTGTWKLVEAIMKDTQVGDLTLSAEYFLGQSGTGATSSVLQINEDSTASV